MAKSVCLYECFKNVVELIKIKNIVYIGADSILDWQNNLKKTHSRSIQVCEESWSLGWLVPPTRI